MQDALFQAPLYWDPVPIPAVIAQPADGRWHAAYQNPAAQALVAGRTQELFQAAASALESPGTPWSGRLWDRPCTVQTASYPGGQVLLLLHVDDREERFAAAQAALQSALDAANAANRAKSDFLSNMSHDIRTPLNAIIGMTTIAQAHLDERDRLEDCLEKIGLSSRHLLGIINDILDMSRIESGKMTVTPEDFTLADLLYSLMAVFRPQAEKKRQQIHLDFNGVRHEQVRGDQLRIQQVLLNILSNAVKFTPEDGSISLTVLETDARTSGPRPHAYYRFQVTDTGMGMSPAFLEKLFLPFERAEGVHNIQGTGLGMAITQNLVKMMNGQIAVESTQGQGTTFTVTLPLELLDSEESRLEVLRGLRVLAADTDAPLLGHLRENLRELGLVCNAVATGQEALDWAVEAHLAGEDYFAILLAWRLPDLDGIQVCRELRAFLPPEAPVFLMSSYEWPYSADEMRKLGITGFLPKPLFRTRVSEVLYACTPEGKAARDRADRAEEPRFEGVQVLLVEDNEINREIGVELLEMLGASVECAEDGQQAVDRFRQEPHRFDLIFMDIQMPVMNGLDATRAIRALPGGSAVPIVAMTANAFVEDIQACRQAGMDDHVPKPVNLQTLGEAMARFLAGKEGSP